MPPKGSTPFLQSAHRSGRTGSEVAVTPLGGTLATLPNFLAYFVTGAVLTALFLALYSNLTPQRDVSLIRAGNSAAATVLIGALIGFEMPLASVIAHSAALLDVVVWGIVALVGQLGGFLVARPL